MRTPHGHSPDDAVRVLAEGHLLAFPTETVWGLAADSQQPRALEALRNWKGRDAAQPTSVLVSGVAAARALGLDLSETALVLADAFWPGPLTLVVPGRPGQSGALGPLGRQGPVAREDGAVGLRCSSHPVAAALAEAAEGAGLGPLTATSFNRHGAAPATDWSEAAALARSCVPALVCLDASPDAWGEAPSTVLDCTGGLPRILRSGTIDRAALESRLEASGIGVDGWQG